jgi:hypothetical protein
MKLKSRLMGVLIVLCVVVGMASPAFAQYSLTLEAKDGAGNPKTQFAKGDDLYLHINLNNAGGVAGCAFTLNFPANVLEPPATDAEGLSSGVTSTFPFVYTNPSTQVSTPTHRENSAEAGKIYFAGAQIATDGGAVYDSGPITLFTVKFQVKTDAPAGAFSPTLAQTELFNPAAGYGTDVNGNGIYETGDTKGTVPVLVGAVAQGEPGFDNFNCSDYPNTPCAFPAYQASLGSLQLEVNEPVAHDDELILNYGVAYGLWHYAQGTGWVQLNTVAPSQMVTVDIDNDGVEELVAGFEGYGLYAYKQGIGWTPMNTVIPDSMLRFNNGVLCDYGPAYGLWFYSAAGGWVQLNTIPPSRMVAADIDNDGVEELVAGFEGYGLYAYKQGIGWTQMNTVIPDAMVRFNNGVACDYGTAYGLWFYSAAGGWVQFNSVDPDKIVAVDLDNDSQDELVISFAGYGLYTYKPGAGYAQINAVIPDVMIRQGNGIAANYGAAYGLWVWSQGGGWLQVNTVPPDNMMAVDLDKDGAEEMVATFAGYGLHVYKQGSGWSLLNAVIPEGMMCGNLSN